MPFAVTDSNWDDDDDVALVELGAQSVIEREGLKVEVRETELNLQCWRRVIEEEEKDDDEV
ncbi:unnamed protein product [Prunus armeniaca]|uniref:Uncharacterized protein n=1 Tax=Prunus armeniaca TaxID=36596 RepID=A0A6J5VY89_PRUAR|nr:unnamed protein product [Prunus armeniaca]